MFKFIYKTITNPIIGPIVVSSIILSLLVIFYLPTLSLQNQKDKVVLESLTLIDHLKIFRSYYNEAIVKKLKSKTDIVIDYNHEIASNTIPLPATVIYNLSERLNNERGITVNFFSDYPFPNRQKRVLDGHQKESLSFLRKNPSETFVKEDYIDNKKVLRVTVSDILTSQECLNCHNNRIDTPKNDWKLGEVRGAFEVIMPLEEQFLLNPIQIKSIIAFMLLVIASFILHYTILFLKREKEIKSETALLEEEVFKRTKDLNSSNLLLLEYKKAVDASAIVSKSDLRGIITYVNDTFCEISGYRKEELISKPHNIVRHPDMPKEFFSDLWNTIKAKKIFKGILKNINKNGTTYYIASTIVPILDNNGDIIEYLSLRYDITELVDAKEKAEIAEKAKSIFLANMSHEIRTPLNAIMGFSNILAESSVDIENKENAKIISRSAKSLLGIINDVLDISKIESGKLDLFNESFHFESFIENIVELFSIAAKEKKIRFIYNPDAILPYSLISDSTRLQQILSNLLSNAIKFTPEYGEIIFSVKLVEKNEDRAKLRFSIKDNGIGMSLEQQKNIFNPFSQADDGISRKFGGTGLGLSICSDIIKLMNSKIELISNINEGSEFSFNLDFEIDKFKNEKKILDNNFKFLLYCSEGNNDILKENIENHINKLGQVFDYEKSDKKGDILFCCGNKNLEFILKEFKKNNEKSFIIFVGDENNISECTSKNYINHYLDLPIYGSKLFNIISENLKLNSIVINKVSSSNKKFKGKILIAEDNLNNQKLIQILLNKLGLESTIVSNGEEALFEYKKEKYDLILMDINMPVMDGLSATKEIREFEKELNYNIPIIALTANSIAGDKEKYLSQGMDDYLSKPIEFNILVAILEKYLKNDFFKKITSNKIDLLTISKKLELPHELIQKLYELFKKETVEDLKQLEYFIINDNKDKIIEKLYYIKNSCLNVGLDEAIEILEKMQNQIMENKDELINEFNKLTKIISHACDL